MFPKIIVILLGSALAFRLTFYVILHFSYGTEQINLEFDDFTYLPDWIYMYKLGISISNEVIFTIFTFFCMKARVMWSKSEVTAIEEMIEEENNYKTL